MGIKVYKPYTPSRRHMTGYDFSEVTKHEPYRPLTVAKRSSGGRNNRGRVSSRHIGGGHRQRYRIIDFRRDKDGIEATVESVEYDPNRAARIALLKFADGEKRYILHPLNLKAGDKVFSGEKVEPRVGNCMPLRNIPIGMYVHNVELRPGAGGQIIRSAGTYGQLLSKEGNIAVVMLPSGEVRKMHSNCRATIGQLSLVEHSLVTIGKAGRSRWLGNRSKVRGVAMNPVSHPMGGGVGRKVGRHPVSKWGILAKGGKTRNPRKPSSKFIVRRRPAGPHNKTV